MEINANFTYMIDVKKELQVRAKALKMSRINCELSQSQLSQLSGICEKTISRMERGLSFWRIDTELILMKVINEQLNAA
jgi:DNA-binding XRE family transcriptional regulator